MDHEDIRENEYVKNGGRDGVKLLISHYSFIFIYLFTAGG